jgi:hypothetical protein
MNKKNDQSYYILALAVAVGLLFHGASFLSTLEDTYDIYVHIFFADHYTKSWFEPWDDRWYTGFSLISYPPLVHQLIALLSFISGLKFAAYLLSFGIVVLYVTGAYRFSKLITANNEAASYAALMAVFLPSVIEAFHVFGQIPMMMGISWLLHSLPEIYKYVRFGKFRYFLNGISLIAVAICSHHVTPIFGMVFFVVPLMGTAVMDGARAEVGNYADIGIPLFFKYVKKYIGRIVFFGFMTIIVAVFVILPYWIWSKNDPIAQVSIPHGSRDSFIEVFSSGLVFFIIPWGFLLLLIPYYFYRYFSKRNIFLGLSFAMLTVLGTGGTTPLPKMLLGENAFNILTLERFTFWATIYAMPLAGEFLFRFTKGDFYQKIIDHRSKMVHSLYLTILIICIFFSAGFTMNLSFFRPLQPKSIDFQSIENFLQSDKHYKWRYLTLGFGDQMAWLSANTNAKTIDGNYHSARRVPELTTRAIERLENAKYRGIEGIVTLQQFLASPETFHLKYIFSNDRFYDPILYFMGWHRVKLLSNGIMVWERSDVSTLPAVLPKKDIPQYQKLLWGVIPMLTLIFAFFCNVQIRWFRLVGNTSNRPIDDYGNPEIMRQEVVPALYHIMKYWIILILTLSLLLVAKIYLLNVKQLDAERVVTSYYDALDFKKFEEAHSFLNPDEGISLDLFLLQTSVTDGIVDSYGKIDSISHEVLERKEHYAKIKTTLSWITPLDSYTKSVVHEVVKKGWKWYIKPESSNNYIPTDQFSSVSDVHFINQGRRKITTEETFHEDILDRPVLEIMESHLVKRNEDYHIIGYLQNVDSYPADLTIKASLLNEDGAVLTSYYDKYYTSHKLMSKEITPFRIDFDEVAWRQDTAIRAQHPVSYKLEVLASVANQDLYKKVAFQVLETDTSQIKGTMYNYGNLTSTITQVIYGLHDKNRNLIWVDAQLTEKSVFPKKSTPFSISLVMDVDQIEILDVLLPILEVNGLRNEDITAKYKSSKSVGINNFIMIKGDKNLNVQLYLNNFIGNPTPF